MIALWIELLAVTFAPKPRWRARHQRSFFPQGTARAVVREPEARTIDITPAPPRGNGLAIFALFFLAIWVIIYALFLYPGFMNWGATLDEQRMALPGDELIQPGQAHFTRAITISAPPAAVWPWILQMGQDRAGFYSNTWLENLTGANIHNADLLHPEWRNRHLGDVVTLARSDLFGGYFADITQTHIVGMEKESWIAFIPTRFVLQPIGNRGTRLIVREALSTSPLTRIVNVLSWDPMHFIMEQRMLRGIKERAEGSPVVDHGFMVAAEIGWIASSFALFLFFLVEGRRIPWLLIPLLWAIPVYIFTLDWQASLAAFQAAAIALACPLAYRRRWWIAAGFVTVATSSILLLSPDPYVPMGCVLGIAALAAATTL